MTPPSFAVTSLITEQPNTYNHGYSIQEVDKLKTAKAELDKRNLTQEPVTLEEFKTIVVPWNRVLRVEEFILADTKKPKEKATRIVKPKKLTKKAIKEKLNVIIFKKASGKELTKDEQIFMDEQFALAGVL